jgi:hypothetical protein
MRFDATGHPRLKAEEGSNLVEFAFIVLLLMSMMLGIIDFSRALYSYHFISNAAREATRYAAVRGYTCTNDGSCVDDGNCTSYATTTCDPDNDDSSLACACERSHYLQKCCGWSRPLSELSRVYCRGYGQLQLQLYLSACVQAVLLDRHDNVIEHVGDDRRSLTSGGSAGFATSNSDI